MKSKLVILLLLACGTTASGEGDPASRLKGARSLRCAFTATVETLVKNGRRSVEPTNDKSAAAYDDINVEKGTGRIIANSGASDLVVWRDRQDTLWMLERTPSGNEVVTTVFPMYAEGTDEFVVLESRHWLAIGGKVAAGETTFGTCRILE